MGHPYYDNIKLDLGHALERHLGGVVVSILEAKSGDPGSIPGWGAKPLHMSKLTT